MFFVMIFPNLKVIELNLNLQTGKETIKKMMMMMMNLLY